ncbi:3-dehydroshikimate dehydratase [Alternaria alternata]|nr:3-dehydroshikimate dehydratase [Alternaria alternata]
MSATNRSSLPAGITPSSPSPHSFCAELAVVPRKQQSVTEVAPCSGCKFFSARLAPNLHLRRHQGVLSHCLRRNSTVAKGTVSHFPALFRGIQHPVFAELV